MSDFESATITGVRPRDVLMDPDHFQSVTCIVIASLLEHTDRQ